MRTLPKEIMQILVPFAPLFSENESSSTPSSSWRVRFSLPPHAPSVPPCGRWVSTNRAVLPSLP
jgi:hypothetical protein